ncbi:MAG: cyclopropane-fatty-acyl-phospholipid synthase family protein [Nocardioidaceae bacterium]
MTAPPVAATRTWPELAEPPATLRTRVAASVVEQLLTRVASRYGVRVVLPGQPVPADDAPVLVLHRPEEFYRRTGRDLLIGFGESYMTGAWDSPDLARLLTVLARDIGTLVPERLQRWRRLYVARHPRAHRNTVDNSRSNISHHYDLSNELFATFLDETMTYSSALFAQDPPGDVTRGDLAEAQLRKIDRLLDETRVGPGSRVLEIGTGWGELAVRAAARGAAVTSVTLSAEQQSLARERIAAAGLADRVEVRLTDYREVRGSFDAVVSVEMIEAVGHEYLPSYFRTLHDRLEPGGRAGIQAILMPHDRMLATLGTHTWIHRYIFPGGFLPSTVLLDEVSRAAGLREVSSRSFGRHYAETLRLWDERFLAADVEALGFDEVFRRMWHFYLTYSRAGFASGYLDVSQLVYQRERG